MKKISVILAFIPALIFSQQKLTYRSDIELKTTIDSLSKLDKYQEIVDVLDLINKNDSIIGYADVQKSYYNLELEKYNEVVNICDNALKKASEDNTYLLYINKAAAHVNLKNNELAIKTYTQAIEKFPMNSELYRRRGQVYVSEKLFSKAYLDYQKAIEINPYHVNNHLSLGDLFFKQRKFAQALMVYDIYLLMSPDGDNSYNILNYLNTQVASKYIKASDGFRLTNDDEKFEEIDLLIDNRIALSKKYKIKNKIDIAFVRQNHLLFSKIKDVSITDTFFNKYYYKIFEWMIDGDMFNDFVYTTCYAIKNKKFLKIVKSKKSKVVAFYQLFSDEYAKYADVKKTNIDKKEVYYTYKDSELVGIGTKVNTKYNGLWEFYNQLGRKTADGYFDSDEKRTGKWTWYNKKGNIREQTNYKNGLTEGEFSTYYDNGNLKNKGLYKNDLLEGDYLSYSENGALKEIKTFKSNKLDGVYKNFHEVGQSCPNYVLNYKNGKAQGVLNQYFDTGEIYYQTNYVDDEKQGKTQYFYKNGLLEKEYTSILGLREGEFKEYYSNGKLYQKGNYTADKAQGLWKRYYVDQKKFRDFEYSNGSLHNFYKEYDHTGNLYLEYQYKKGKLYKTTFYDKNQKVLNSKKKEYKQLDYKGYGVLGNLKAEGVYNIKDGHIGTWRYYDINGGLSLIENYNSSSELEGELLSYHSNGKLKKKVNYNNGLLDGYWVKYFSNGQMYAQGYYKNDVLDKLAIYYYPDGTIKSKNYYHKGELHGTQYYYHEHGVLDYVNNYEYGYLKNQISYKSKGKEVLNVYDYTSMGSVPTVKTTFFHNGAIQSKLTYVNGVLHGAATYYFPNGNIRSKGMYSNGNFNNKWEWYFDNKKIRIQANYLGGELDGNYKKFYKNGNISILQTYILGENDGVYFSYAKDGKTVINKISYVLGRKHGETKFYSTNGELQLVRYYDMGVLKGYSYLNKEGNLLKMIPIDNETIKLKSYYQNGNISREFEIEHGEFVNSYVRYFSNGKIESKSTYYNDEKNGENILYYPNGNVKEYSNFILGNYHGVYKKYYENGQLETEYTYVNDEAFGPYRVYSEHGDQIEKGNYYDGFKFKE